MKNTFLKKAASPFEHLFWRAQIRLLRACPPLLGVASKVSLNAYKSRKIWIKTLLHVAAQVPHTVLQHWHNKRGKRIVIPRISIPVTTRCTLNCDKCAVHIPDLKCCRDIPTDILLNDIRSLLSCVDNIYDISLSGGEVFLHPDLDAIVRTCDMPDKVDSINVVTNGTVIPDAKTLAALRDAKVIVKITRYSEALQPHVEKLKSILKENQVSYIHTSGAYWNDIGSFGQRKAGSEKRRFSICVQQLCYPLYNGKLHLCLESATLMEEGLVPDCKEDYIDLRATCPAAFREQFEKLLKRRAISACSYCLGHTYKSPRVPVAEQRSEPHENPLQ